MGHDGEDPGEFDPLVVHSYQFDAAARVWRRRVVSWGGGVGFGLDPEAADLDADGDLDLVCPGRSGLYWLENRRIARDPVPGGPPAAEVPRPEYEDHTRVLEVIDLSGRKRRVVSREGWSLRRSHVLHGLERAMGALPGPERRAPLAVEVLERVEMDDYVRTKLSYSPDALEPGDRVPAYLLVPKGLAGKAPAVLCLHQTTAIGKGEPAGLGGRPTLRYADELARRGYVCLAPDYPSFGEYRYDFSAAAAAGRYVSGSMKAVWNNVRAIDLLESLAEVDADRIGCIGHSLGGHNAVFTAAFDQRLRVVVTSCGFTAFHDYYGGNLCGWTSERYMPRIREVYASDPDRVPFDFHELIAALAPRPVFVNAPLSDDNFPAGGVRKVIAAAASVYELWDAADKLQVEVPDAPHEFPDEVRERAYRFLDAHLER
jgi:dienelactone hydrolase